MSVFFFNDTATTEIYTLSLHDALPILVVHVAVGPGGTEVWQARISGDLAAQLQADSEVLGLSGRTEIVKAALQLLHQRSEEHTSELQSRQYLVCRLLLEKKT